MDKRDLYLLEEIQKSLDGIGTIHKYSNRSLVNYSIDSIKDLNVLINHFDKYPLISKKAADYKLFKEVISLIENKEHLTVEGLNKIINIKAAMNPLGGGLSDFLKNEFAHLKIYSPAHGVEIPDICEANSSLNLVSGAYAVEKIPDPNWISGFVTGEGSFDANITKTTSKLGYRVQLRFRISQHNRDVKLMELIAKYLVGFYYNKDKIYKYPKQDAVCLNVSSLSEINNKIIPFFKQNPILGAKSIDYLDWLKIAKLMNNGKHLTIDGLEEIRNIKSKMNSFRNYTNNI